MIEWDVWNGKNVVVLSLVFFWKINFSLFFFGSLFVIVMKIGSLFDVFIYFIIVVLINLLVILLIEYIVVFLFI